MQRIEVIIAWTGAIIMFGAIVHAVFYLLLILIYLVGSLLTFSISPSDFDFLFTWDTMDWGLLALDVIFAVLIIRSRE